MFEQKCLLPGAWTRYSARQPLCKCDQAKYLSDVYTMQAPALLRIMQHCLSGPELEVHYTVLGQNLKHVRDFCTGWQQLEAHGD